MLRHMKTSHNEDNSESDSDMNVSDSDSEGEGGRKTPDEDVQDPWFCLIDRAWDAWQTEYEQKVLYYIQTEGNHLDEAKNRAYKAMIDKYRKTLQKSFVSIVLWFRAITKDPVYKSIKNTVSDLELEDYESEEAWKYAVSKRKYLFEKLLNEYVPPGISQQPTNEQEGSGRQLATAAEGPIQILDRWAENEVKRIRNGPEIEIIGKVGRRC